MQESKKAYIHAASRRRHAARIPEDSKTGRAAKTLVKEGPLRITTSSQLVDKVF